MVFLIQSQAVAPQAIADSFTLKTRGAKMAKKKDADVVEKKDKKSDIVEKKPKKAAKKQEANPGLTESQEGLIDNFISLLNEMKVDKESAESRLSDLMEEEGIGDDYFEDYRAQFLNAIIIRYLEIYGALTEKEMMEVFSKHFPYSTVTEPEIQEALEDYFELYHAEDKYSNAVKIRRCIQSVLQR